MESTEVSSRRPELLVSHPCTTASKPATTNPFMHSYAHQLAAVFGALKRSCYIGLTFGNNSNKEKLSGPLTASL